MLAALERGELDVALGIFPDVPAAFRARRSSASGSSAWPGEAIRWRAGE